MRIVGGKWAGRKLTSPGGRVRPTGEELRAAWMELLGSDLEGARCVDLFAGTGALGLEALSRGAKSCDFVENADAAMHSLKANIAALKARKHSRIFERDAIVFVERITQVGYDIAFADPPYGSMKLDRVIKRWMAQPFSRILTVEHAPDHALPRKGRTIRVADSAVTLFSLLLAAACSTTTPKITPPTALAPKTTTALGTSSLAPTLPAALDSIIGAAIRDSVTSGAAVAVGRHGRVELMRTYGTTDFSSTSPVTDSTIYDLASLTKVVATTTAAMVLEEDGLLDIERPVVFYLPEFNAPDKAAITVRMLLLHRSGIRQVAALHEKYGALAEYIAQINAIPLRGVPGDRTEYTDWNMVVLQAVIERVSGKPLDVLTHERIFAPLGMRDTGYRPNEMLRARAAPTRARGELAAGVVHDPTGFALGGVSGNAGLFSSTRDLALFAQMMLNGGTYAGVRILHPPTISRWTARQQRDASRALGWDTPADSSSAGRFMSPWSFGHTGFTGTSIWVDPNADMYVVLLSNYTRPSSNNPRIRALRWAVDNAVRSAVLDMPLRDWQNDAKEPAKQGAEPIRRN